MRRLLSFALILTSPLAFGQTTLDITLPGNTVCSYTTGAVTNGSTPGHLQATATSSSGAGCGSGGTGNVTFGPASPASASPSNLGSNTGTSNINFQVLNATQCVGSISPSAGASFTGGNTLCTGTGAGSCQNPVSATASFDNENTTSQNYTVTVTCNGATGQAVSTTSVTALGVHQGGTCATIPNSKGGVFTQLIGTKAINHFGNNTNIDITSFDAAFGTVSKPHWPGSYGLGTVFFLPESNYISLAFTVPTNYFSGSNASVYGHYTLGQGTSGYSAPVSMSISTSCGDFSPPTSSGSSTLCVKNAKGPNGFIDWYSADTTCKLVNGKTYYFNFINADISGVTPTGGSATTTANDNCSNGSCANAIYNKLGSWTD